jgi:ubiquinone biosynthesis protein
MERLRAEAPRYAHIFPQLPRLVHQALTVAGEPRENEVELMKTLLAEQRQTNRLLSFIVYFVGAFALGALGFQLFMRWHQLPF